MAKLFTKETRRPVGCPASAQLPVSSKDGFQQTDLDDFSADAVDLDPVADADAVAPHQHEPSKEGDDEVFHGDGQACARQAQDRSRLRGHAENDEQNCDRAHRLRREFHHRPQRVDALVLGGHAREQLFNETVRQVHRQQNQQNPQQALDRYDAAQLRSRVSTSAIQLCTCRSVPARPAVALPRSARFF